MAMSLNRVQLIGNVTKDPEVRQIPGGTTVATFSVATNFSWKDQNGQRQDKAEYHNLVAWRKLGEICAQYVRKGTKVFVEGRIQSRDWEGKDGVKRSRTEIVLDNMIMLDKKGGPVGELPVNMGAGGSNDHDEMNQSDDREHGSVKSSAGAATADLEEEISIEDLPF